MHNRRTAERLDSAFFPGFQYPAGKQPFRGPLVLQNVGCSVRRKRGLSYLELAAHRAYSCFRRLQERMMRRIAAASRKGVPCALLRTAV
jgi:hypothetical protein